MFPRTASTSSGWRECLEKSPAALQKPPNCVKLLRNVLTNRAQRKINAISTKYRPNCAQLPSQLHPPQMSKNIVRFFESGQGAGASSSSSGGDRGGGPSRPRPLPRPRPPLATPLCGTRRGGMVCGGAKALHKTWAFCGISRLQRPEMSEHAYCGAFSGKVEYKVGPKW